MPVVRPLQQVWHVTYRHLLQLVGCSVLCLLCDVATENDPASAVSVQHVQPTCTNAACSTVSQQRRGATAVVAVAVAVLVITAGERSPACASQDSTRQQQQSSSVTHTVCLLWVVDRCAPACSAVLLEQCSTRADAGRLAHMGVFPADAASTQARTMPSTRLGRAVVISRLPTLPVLQQVVFAPAAPQLLPWPSLQEEGAPQCCTLPLGPYHACWVRDKAGVHRHTGRRLSCLIPEGVIWPVALAGGLLLLRVEAATGGGGGRLWLEGVCRHVTSVSCPLLTACCLASGCGLYNTVASSAVLFSHVGTHNTPNPDMA